MGEQKVKEYPLDIQNVGGDVYIVMSKGHHDPHVFMAKVREEGYTWPLGMPEHKWARATPTKDPSLNCIYTWANPHARGAFPCTYAFEAYNDDAYEAMEQPTSHNDQGE